MFRNLTRLGWVLSLLLALLLEAAEAQAALPQLNDALPEQIRMSLRHRSRWELRDDQPGGPTGGWALRTRLKAVFTLKDWAITGELMDARFLIMEGAPPLGTAFVNPLDVLELNVSRRVSLGPRGRSLALRLGRQAFDMGSRRLVASNRFRNTVNAFGGLWATYLEPKQLQFESFLVFPVERQPGRRTPPDEGERFVFDSEDFESPFLGMRAVLQRWSRTTFEAYALLLYEVPDNFRRRLLTTGFRVHHAPRPGDFDLDLEAVGQLGRSRVDANLEDVGHQAGFFHIGLGYTVDILGAPNLRLGADLASGDNQSSATNEGFDTLFGARRFELGPTGILGVLRRENLNAPFARLGWTPVARWEFLAAYRYVWQVNNSASLVGGPDGFSVGHFGELRIRWDAVLDRLRLEAGGAVSDFSEGRSRGLDSPDSRYVYVQVAVVI